MTNLIIDDEFKNLIPPLSDEEFSQLEENILRDGIQDPLKVWQGALIDGHNRYAIARKHGLEFSTTPMFFATRNDAIVWIIKNQLGRRNLPAPVRIKLALIAEPLIAKQAKEKQISTLKQNAVTDKCPERIPEEKITLLVKNCLESCGFTCYQPTTDAAHIIDFLVSQGKEFKFGVEVKTKPKFKNYPATGFDYRHYLDYKKFIHEMNLPLFIAFVDEVEKKIYGNFLHVLDEPRKFCNMDYPNTFRKNGFTIRYYPMCAMLLIRNLTENEVATLKNNR